MQIKNTKNGYGVIARAFHWGMALAIFGMFALGLWMRTLDYYSPYYQLGPGIHKSAGMTLLILLAGRFIWRSINVRPDDCYLSARERLASHVMHLGFYALLLVQMCIGYLTHTVDGRGIEVFGLFMVPSVYEQKGLEQVTGLIHEYLAYTIIAFAVLHGAAAIKHHFIYKDVTLMRMWRGPVS